MTSLKLLYSPGACQVFSFSGKWHCDNLHISTYWNFPPEKKYELKLGCRPLPHLSGSPLSPLHTSIPSDKRATCNRHTRNPSSYHSRRISRVCKSILHTRESHGERGRVLASACERSRVACNLLARVIRGSYEIPDQVTGTPKFCQISLLPSRRNLQGISSMLFWCGD